jgi:hypothetical protein
VAAELYGKLSKIEDMKKIILIVLVISLLTVIACCKVLFPDEKLSLQRQDYIGTKLRTDGYYYSHFEGTGVIALFFLYRNGVSMSAGGYTTLDLSEIEKRIVNYNAKSKSSWGVFAVNGDTIQQEMWVGSIYSRPNVYRLVYCGNIENDTTIHFTKIYSSETNITRSIDEVWHFKQFSPKPDSTNVYIK